MTHARSLVFSKLTKLAEASQDALYESSTLQPPSKSPPLISKEKARRYDDDAFFFGSILGSGVAILADRGSNSFTRWFNGVSDSTHPDALEAEILKGGGGTWDTVRYDRHHYPVSNITNPNSKSPQLPKTFRSGLSSAIDIAKVRDSFVKGEDVNRLSSISIGEVPPAKAAFIQFNDFSGPSSSVLVGSDKAHRINRRFLAHELGHSLQSPLSLGASRLGRSTVARVGAQLLGASGGVRLGSDDPETRALAMASIGAAAAPGFMTLANEIDADVKGYAILKKYLNNRGKKINLRKYLLSSGVPTYLSSAATPLVFAGMAHSIRQQAPDRKDPK